MTISPDMEITAVVICLLAYAGFREWLRQQRRAIVHRERMSALEKGIELPPLEQEQQRRSWNVQRTLLLAGLVWISIGTCAFITLSALLQAQHNGPNDLPHGIQWIGLAPFAIGVSHLVVYWMGKKREE